ncbi:cytochrome P450 [Laspinema olomoucense]|uniref:Cytochrome P450 n=1 Tax=Laspinema olomoucense D3b TaxID=2953688 RepID=A0ABT2N2Z1_9CYAN|nr:MULTISPECIES: cytochrome P450 [unclassified Laspinema]MCT7974144.1 cytochrome P450 [Laspinema sp. D3d]MCT7977037.1 cytochrome P450 [Laspinema sp. D3b]
MTSNETRRSLPLPPGKLGLPLVGETVSFLRDRDFQKKRREKYGTVYKTHLFGQPTVVLIGSEANRFLFTHDNSYFTATWPESTRILLGPQSLAIQSGNEHTTRRRLMAQAFLPKAIAGYLPGMEQLTHRYLKQWETPREMTWYPELRTYMFDIASTLLIGTETGSETAYLGQIFKTFCGGLFSIPINLPWTQFGKALRSRTLLLEKVEELVRRRQQETEPRTDALGLLLAAKDEQGNGLTLDEIKDQVLLLLFAGHETLTSSLSSFCLLLAQHPQVITKLREEQEQLGFTGSLTMEMLKEMTYLEQVIKEVLRLIPPVGGGFRRVVKSCEFSDYQIPEGWMALYQITQTHQDSSIYPNPKEFDPDRFSLNRTEEKQKAFGFIPFGGGARECVGKAFAMLVLRVFGTHLVHGYDWELLPDQNLELVTVPTPSPRDGLRVKFSRRG